VAKIESIHFPGSGSRVAKGMRAIVSFCKLVARKHSGTQLDLGWDIGVADSRKTLSVL